MLAEALLSRKQQTAQGSADISYYCHHVTVHRDWPDRIWDDVRSSFISCLAIAVEMCGILFILSIIKR